MNLVDSSGWLEYFADGPNADFFAPSIKDTNLGYLLKDQFFKILKKLKISRKLKIVV